MQMVVASNTTVAGEPTTSPSAILAVMTKVPESRDVKPTEHVPSANVPVMAAVEHEVALNLVLVGSMGVPSHFVPDTV
jgi:hypothetical protein